MFAVTPEGRTVTKTPRKRTVYQNEAVKRIKQFANGRRVRCRFYGLTKIYAVMFHRSMEWRHADRRYKDPDLGALLDWCDEQDGKVTYGTYKTEIWRPACSSFQAKFEVELFCVLIKP